jgi:hypothetical protein
MSTRVMGLVVLVVAFVVAQILPLISIVKPFKMDSVDNCETPQCTLVFFLSYDYLGVCFNLVPFVRFTMIQ